MEYVNYIECFSEDHDDTDELIFGLRDETQKRLNSKYFYDENGSILFDQITDYNIIPHYLYIVIWTGPFVRIKTHHQIGR